MLGEVIHGYRVDRALSADKGGFGDVYFATHVDSGAEAVVKVLKPEMSARHDIVTRFFNEARAAASVHHPGIVQIHNVGYHGDRAYLLMERLRGDDLENRLQAGPLPLDRALVFVRQAAGAIGAAHDRGIVHRDLKPANLFVVADPDVVGGERVKVLDFGIAKLTVEAGAGKTQGVFGTPSYMSPEQCASTAAVDGRADLYSLGCILYELVCGRPPFGHGGLEVIAAHLRDAPMPPRAIAPWVPPAVEQVILRLLEKQPERRYASCAELIAALDQAGAGIAPSGATPSTVPTTPTPGNAATSRSPRDAARPPGPSTVTAQPSSPALLQRSSRRGLAIGLGIGGVIAVGAVLTLLATRGGSGRPSPSSAGDEVAAILVDAAAAGATAATPSADADPVAADAAPMAVDPAPMPIDAGVAASSPTRRPPVVSSPPKPPAAEDPRSALLNEQGKEAMMSDRWELGAAKFREAIAVQPQAKYFVNLCTALLQSGRYQEAIDTCKQVRLHHPTPEQSGKAAKLIERTRAFAAKQNVRLPN